MEVKRKNGSRESLAPYEPITVELHEIAPQKVLCSSPASAPLGASFKASKGSKLF